MRVSCVLCVCCKCVCAAARGDARCVLEEGHHGLLVLLVHLDESCVMCVFCVLQVCVIVWCWHPRQSTNTHSTQSPDNTQSYLHRRLLYQLPVLRRHALEHNQLRTLHINLQQSHLPAVLKRFFCTRPVSVWGRGRRFEHNKLRALHINLQQSDLPAVLKRFFGAFTCVTRVVGEGRGAYCAPLSTNSLARLPSTFNSVTFCNVLRNATPALV